MYLLNVTLLCIIFPQDKSYKDKPIAAISGRQVKDVSKDSFYETPEYPSNNRTGRPHQKITMQTVTNVKSMKNDPSLSWETFAPLACSESSATPVPEDILDGFGGSREHIYPGE